jgi:hypothetical protein
MKAVQLVGAACGIILVACATVACGGKVQEEESAAPIATHADGITLTSSTPERLTGVYADGTGNTIQFDLAKVNNDLFADATGNGGRPILHIETAGDDYNFSYLGGALTMHTTKTFIAQASAQAGTQPQGVSTDGFAFSGDMNVLDGMLKLPEVAQLPTLSRALGVRGITGNDFPASLVLHKVAQQSAQALNVNVAQVDTPEAVNGYCQAYPDRADSCYGMCGPGCSCWSWVCGDCCYHSGCAVHDSWCREGKWWYCDDITAVIALFGC